MGGREGLSHYIFVRNTSIYDEDNSQNQSNTSLAAVRMSILIHISFSIYRDEHCVLRGRMLFVLIKKSKI